MVLHFESGNDLSSQHLSASTFGVRKLNFCVRYGNRWILFAIITTMVIYSAYRRTYTFFSVPLLSRFPPFLLGNELTFLLEVCRSEED